MILLGTFVLGILVGCFIERRRLGLTSWSCQKCDYVLPKCQRSCVVLPTCNRSCSKPRRSRSRRRSPYPRYHSRRRSPLCPRGCTPCPPRRSRSLFSRTCYTTDTDTCIPTANIPTVRIRSPISRSVTPPRDFDMRPPRIYPTSPARPRPVPRPRMRPRSRPRRRRVRPHSSILPPVRPASGNVEVTTIVGGNPPPPPGKRWTDGMLYRRPGGTRPALRAPVRSLRQALRG
ncbi:serine/arginine repetitive matrix protein 1-like [Homalodisca vitripennis]|uniref:serine/arginine repetitive matrix protein 1-like n=1 Tax=Homalodisca vitripennis TaxID=197043 RepID=UPI001EEBC1C6|nr:serine/arginine repetitive matrix protein 1-like [Homalodisca vitripennis]